MALTSSNALKNNFIAPDFELLNTTDDQYLSLNDLKGEQGTCILFICNHCPYVKLVQDELVRIADTYLNKCISFIAISSNDIDNYPEDAPQFMKETAIQHNYPFPYLYDEDQSVAKAYDAACTPDIYLFNEHLELYYHGQLDQARPGNNIQPNGQDLRNAIDRLIEGQPSPKKQHPSIGCSIKWKV